MTKELVTIGLPPGVAPFTDTAVHLTPLEFHAEVVSAAAAGDSSVVLIDTRNLYETRVGTFSAPGMNV